MKTEKAVHHGVEVTVVSEVAGRHRKICLCFDCKFFKPGEPDNCPIAQATFDNCVKYSLTTPVTECPVFEVVK